MHQPPVLVYSPEYNTDLRQYGVNKPFALDRGQCVLNRLEEDSKEHVAVAQPRPLSLEEILLVHSEKYVQTLNDPETWRSIFELKEDEFDPGSATRTLNELLDDIRLKCGGTLLACELALAHGMSANLGGGYHHAFPDEGRGFCVLHDIAIAIRSLQKRRLCKNVLVLDLDFHQGDGTAVVFHNDPSVYTLSVHSEEGWPEEKQKSTLDVAVKTTEVVQYQDKVEDAVSQALSEFSPDLCVYVAGSDPYEKDILPGTRFIRLSLEEMRRRDEFVIDTFAECEIPLAMVFAGGYGPHVWEVHYWAVRRLLERSKELSVAPIAG
jgi:acetoin utilization deacetylase AcuC-like enzyme